MSLARLIKERKDRVAAGALHPVRSPALQRIRVDLDNLDGIDGVVRVSSRSPFELHVVLRPTRGFWSGGEFHFRLDCPEKYPFEAPRVRYTGPRRIFHPNIEGEENQSEWGVCLNLPMKWRPTHTIRDLVLGLELLFVYPSEDDTLSGVAKAAGQMLRDDPQQFARVVKKYMQAPMQECVDR